MDGCRMWLSAEARRAGQVPRSWAYRQLWAAQRGCWLQNVGPLWDHAVFEVTALSPQTLWSRFLKKNKAGRSAGQTESYTNSETGETMRLPAKLLNSPTNEDPEQRMGRNAMKKGRQPMAVRRAPVSSLTTPALPSSCLHSPRPDTRCTLCVSECGRLATQTLQTERLACTLQPTAGIATVSLCLDTFCSFPNNTFMSHGRFRTNYQLQEIYLA